MANVFPPDPNSLIGQVRLQITDWPETEAELIFSDAQIQAFLAISRDNVLRAASNALLAIAANEALLYKYLRTDDLTVDGVKTATEIRLTARDLERKADAEDASDNEFFLLSYPNLSDGYDGEYVEYRLPHSLPEW